MFLTVFEVRRGGVIKLLKEANEKGPRKCPDMTLQERKEAKSRELLCREGKEHLGSHKETDFEAE